MATNGRTPRIQKQAVYEINVVRSCRDNYAEKLDDLQKEIDEMSAVLALKWEEGKASVDAEERKKLAREVSQLKDRLDIKKNDAECFQDNITMLEDLLVLLDSFFAHERFRYIVKKIPEKKLPSMVKDPSKIEEVNELIFSLLDEFRDRWQKYLILMKKREEERKHRKNVDAVIKERNERNDAGADEVLAEWDAAAPVKAQSTATTKKLNNN